MDGIQGASGNIRRPDTPMGSSSRSVEVLARAFGEVTTERLSLRRPTADDSAAIFSVHGDPETNRCNPHGPDPDLATSEARLTDWLHHWQDDGYGYWAVAVAPHTEVIGFGGIRRMRWRDRSVLNLYYRFAPVAWNYGYATEVARQAISLAHVHLPHLPIVARTRSDNHPSQRTAERAGLRRRPDLDDHDYIVFALGWEPMGAA